VIFEKWATISIKIAKPIIPDAGTGEGYHEKDIDRTFESAGVAGRRYYAYTADTVQHALLLQNKNKNYPNEKWQLAYQFLNDSTIVVKGVNERQDSVYAVLNRVNKKYLLFEGRRKPIKL
jgi:2-C-methyl-D-erythritol 4-phosphate cytidylyltransferase